MNIHILGALLKNACHANSYPYISDILYMLIDKGIKPSKEFLTIIDTYHGKTLSRFIRKRNFLPEKQTTAFFQFSREYKRWQKRTGLYGLQLDEAVKMIQEHPWKQFKESQPEGEENVKNSKKMHLRKKGHLLHKFRDAKLDDEGGYKRPERLSSENNQGPKKREKIERNHPWEDAEPESFTKMKTSNKNIGLENDTEQLEQPNKSKTKRLQGKNEKGRNKLRDSEGTDSPSQKNKTSR